MKTTKSERIAAWLAFDAARFWRMQAMVMASSALACDESGGAQGSDWSQAMTILHDAEMQERAAWRNVRGKRPKEIGPMFVWD